MLRFHFKCLCSRAWRHRTVLMFFLDETEVTGTTMGVSAWNWTYLLKCYFTTARKDDPLIKKTAWRQLYELLWRAPSVYGILLVLFTFKQRLWKCLRVLTDVLMVLPWINPSVLIPQRLVILYMCVCIYVFIYPCTKTTQQDCDLPIFPKTEWHSPYAGVWCHTRDITSQEWGGTLASFNSAAAYFCQLSSGNDLEIKLFHFF